MIAVLLAEPFWLTLDQIADLTDRQIIDLYFHPRNKEGRIDVEGGFIPSDIGPAESEAAAFAIANSLGVSEKRLRELRAKRREREQSDRAVEQENVG